VIAGHVDSVDRPGAFFLLRSVHPGDAITVTRADGSVVRFAVTRVARFAKADFPTAEVYGATPDPELRLVTCGGAFDRAARSFVDVVLVFARAVLPS
jgi:sortase (surface protein transpeptidase)